MRSTLRVVYIDFGTTVDIGRPAREVRAVLADYDRDPEWRAGVLSMSADPPGCATAGTTTAEVMRFAGRTLSNNGKIARVGPGCGLTWRTTSGVDAEGVRAVEPRGPDRCRLTPSGRGSSRTRAASTAWSAQSSLGLGFCRRSTATSWCSTSNSASLEAEERASSTIHPARRTKIK